MIPGVDSKSRLVGPEAAEEGEKCLSPFNTYGYNAEIVQTDEEDRPWLEDRDLTRVDRPDGTAWELRYDNASLPGSITRWDLIGTDLVRRVEGAWEYDARGNVIKAWRGDTVSTSSDAVALYTLSYDDPISPTQTQVTDPLGKLTTYAIARDTVSNVPKITQINGDCPVCGTGPNAQYSYADPANPLLPTQVIDGRGLRTQYTYDAKGQMTSKTEAVGTPLERTTFYQYGNPSFPAFPTRIEVPSTSGGSAQRVTVLSYDAAGDLETQTIQGAEAGGSFSFDVSARTQRSGEPGLWHAADGPHVPGPHEARPSDRADPRLRAL
jgi:YD repeat-containing protein